MEDKGLAPIFVAVCIFVAVMVGVGSKPEINTSINNDKNQRGDLSSFAYYTAPMNVYPAMATGYVGTLR